MFIVMECFSSNCAPAGAKHLSLLPERRTKKEDRPGYRHFAPNGAEEPIETPIGSEGIAPMTCKENPVATAPGSVTAK